jgi:hypothetical protein
MRIGNTKLIGFIDLKLAMVADVDQKAESTTNAIQNSKNGTRNERRATSQYANGLNTTDVKRPHLT